MGFVENVTEHRNDRTAENTSLHAISYYLYNNVNRLICRSYFDWCGFDRGHWLCRYECVMPVWSCAWNADDRNCFYAGLQNGTVLMFDIRNLAEPVLTLNQDTGSRSPVVSVQYMPAVSGSSVRYDSLCSGNCVCVHSIYHWVTLSFTETKV